MIRARSAIVAAMACVATAAASREALAAPQLTVTSSTAQAEVGESFTVQLKAMVDQGEPQPSSPELVPPRDLSVVGQSEGTQMVMVQSGGQASVRVGLQAQWQVVGQKPGKYTIPGPSVMWNGRRVSGSPIPIEIVPSTGRPRRQPNNPFLMPGGMSFPFGGGFPQPEEAAEPRTAPELALANAPDPSLFILFKVDRNRVVVGQQVSCGTYVYRRIRPPQILSNHDPPLSDFLRIPLTKTPGTDNPVYATAGGNRYVAELVDQMAIFPLHAGDLHTGSVRFTFGGGVLRNPVERASEDQIIHVTEPPRAGRPVGYTLGDVGQFTLTADVQPRRIDEGGEVAVKLRLTGTGNLPQSLRVPERTGIEWLEPERKESIEPQNGVIGGWRTLGYVVRIKESGAVDLGEVTLPYWDPVAGRYQIAKAVLGKIQVSPKLPSVDPRTRQPVDAPPPDPFAGLPSARPTLGAYVAPRPRRLEGNAMWLVIAAPPLLVGAFSITRSAARRVAARRATAKDSPAALAQKALADARAAEKAGDGKTLATALERAVHLAIEGATGLKSRGVLLADLPGELTGHGLAESLAGDLAAALAACDAVRFDPSPSSATTHDLGARVRALVADLGKRETERDPGSVANPPVEAARG